MDDLARHLSISKKTIYKYVKDKNDLVLHGMAHHQNLEQCAMQACLDNNLNAIDENFEISKVIVDQIQNIHPAVMYDLQAIEASRIEGRLAKWTPEFTSLEILYKHRFAPFALVEFPEYVSYAQYAARTDMEKAQISVSGPRLSGIAGGVVWVMVPNGRTRLSVHEMGAGLAVQPSYTVTG